MISCGDLVVDLLTVLKSCLRCWNPAQSVVYFEMEPFDNVFFSERGIFSHTQVNFASRPLVFIETKLDWLVLKMDTWEAFWNSRKNTNNMKQHGLNRGVVCLIESVCLYLEHHVIRAASERNLAFQIASLSSFQKKQNTWTRWGGRITICIKSFGQRRFWKLGIITAFWSAVPFLGQKLPLRRWLANIYQLLLF